MPPRVQQGFFGQGAGRDQPHDIAVHHRFVAAFLRLGRIFQLFGDGDTEALADQRQQIGLGGMNRHAAHGDIGPQMLAAFGQRDVQRLRCRHGIVKEHLIEIAHPIEQQRAGMLRLDRQILRHHRRCCSLVAHICPLTRGDPTKAGSWGEAANAGTARTRPKALAPAHRARRRCGRTHRRSPWFLARDGSE